MHAGWTSRAQPFLAPPWLDRNDLQMSRASSRLERCSGSADCGNSFTGSRQCNHPRRSFWLDRRPQIAGPGIPVPVLAVTGGDLEGLKLEANLSFPATIKQAFSQWRVGLQTDIDDHQVQVVQGSSPGGAFATLYFDADSGLLVRVMRYTDSFVGRFPTQIDYSDYWEVTGVKMPFRWTAVWLDGRETFELTEVKLNVPIDATKFAKPGVAVRPSTTAANP